VTSGYTADIIHHKGIIEPGWISFSNPVADRLAEEDAWYPEQEMVPSSNAEFKETALRQRRC